MGSGNTLLNLQNLQVNGFTVNSPTSITADVTVPDYAPAGQVSVTATTQGEIAAGSNLFTIIQTQPLMLSVVSASGAQGQTETVTITGALTHFATGTSSASFGAGIVVNSVTASSSTSLQVNLTVQPTAALGLRNVSVTTGSEVVSLANAFNVTVGPAAISNLNPASGAQYTAETVVITGSQTNFANGATTAAFGGGILATGIVVNSATQAAVNISIPPTTPVGSYNVSLTTGGEVATILGGFTVTVGAPQLSSVVPSTGPQASTSNVNITGLFTHFVNGVSTASFGAGITTNSLTVSSSTAAVANITISPTAALGFRTVTMTTGTEVASEANAFTVLAGIPQLTSVSPNTGAQGSTQTVTITGVLTNFQAGVSQVSFGGGGVTVGTVTVNGPTQIQVPVTVTQGAAAGARTVTVTTGTEIDSLSGAFTVLPGLPAITILSPNIGVPNSTVTLAITGQFTNFVNGTTQANFGAGISVNGAPEGAFGTVSVSSSTTATATLTIDPAAALGARNITVETNAQVLNVNAGFTVQNTTTTPPVLVTISPVNGATGVPLNTAVTMQFSEPLNRTTVGTNDVILVDSVLQGGTCGVTSGVSGSVTVDASGRVVTFLPSQVLAVGRLYYVCLNYAGVIKDPSGNLLAYTSTSFTTGYAPDTSGPSFLISSILNGDSTVPTNAPVILAFDKPIDPLTTPFGFQVMTGGNPVSGKYGYTPDYRQITFTPTSALSPATTYTASYTSTLEDSVGNELLNPGSFTFTTGAGAETTGPQIVAYTPHSNEITGLNATLSATFSEPLNPVLATTANSYLYYYDPQVGDYTVPGTTISVSADRLTQTLNLPAPLNPSSEYQLELCGYNRVGNPGCVNVTFFTGTGMDLTPPAVNTVSPPAGATGVEVNPSVQAQMSEPIDATSVANSISLSPAAAGAVALASDNVTVTFTPNSSLATTTPYTVTLSGLRDLNGNTMSPFIWSFTTSASSVRDTTGGTITMVPTSGAVNVPTNASVVLSLSEPVDPASVNVTSVGVYDNTIGTYLPGTLTIGANDQSITFSPTPNFEGNHQICVYAGYSASLRWWGTTSVTFTTNASRRRAQRTMRLQRSSP